MARDMRTSLVFWAAVLAAMPALAQPVRDLPISAKAAADFKGLREKPLFAPDRSPPVAFVPPAPEPVVEAPPPEPIPPPPAASAPDWELVGLVRSDRVNSAMFRGKGDPLEFSLRKGETRDGWTLSDIGRFDVTLDSSTGRASLRFPETRNAVPMGMPFNPDL